MRRRAGGAALLLVAALVLAGCGAERNVGAVSASHAGKRAPVCPRPYSAGSPWNSPIARGAAVASDSARLIETMSGPLTSDPTQYTYPLYIVGSRRSKVPVYVQNIASIVTAPRRLHRTTAGIDLHVPLPPRAQPADGSDSQLIAWNPATGDEWGFWQFTNRRDPLMATVPAGAGGRRSPLPVANAYADYWAGGEVVIDPNSANAETARIVAFPSASEMVLSHPLRHSHTAGEQVWGVGASNGYRYNTAFSGIPPHGFASRGAGVPYLAGLVRACEIARGRIDHALAFVAPNTTSRFVYPATKSDGHVAPGQGLPEGARLQLDPRIPDRTIKHDWRCRSACFTIAKALQRYGMYLIDSGGHPKIVVEDSRTAHWSGRIGASTVSPIPVSALRVLR